MEDPSTIYALMLDLRVGDLVTNTKELKLFDYHILGQGISQSQKYESSLICIVNISLI